MTLSITYHPQTISPSTSISGTINLTSPTSFTLGAVTITLSGRAKVKIREHIHYTTRTFRSRGVYFHDTQKVFDGGGFSFKEGSYSWDFKIEVPERAKRQWDIEGDVGRGRGVKGKRVLGRDGIMRVVQVGEGEGEGAGRRFDYFPRVRPWVGTDDAGGGGLPDSCRVAESRWPLEWEGRVEYALIARVERPSPAGGGGGVMNIKGSKLFASVANVGKAVGRGGDLEVIVDIPLRNQLSLTEKQSLQGRQKIDLKRSLGGGTAEKKSSGLGRTISKLTRVKNLDDILSIPSIKGRQVRFTVELPTAIQPQSTVPFIIHATTSTTDAEQPLITASITDLTITLYRKTSVRDDSLAAIEHTAIKQDRDVLYNQQNQQGIDLIFRANRCESESMWAKLDLEDLIHTPALTPSFSTYNIAVEYSLDFEIKIMMMGEVVILKNEEGDIRVLVVPESTQGEEREEAGPSTTTTTTRDVKGVLTEEGKQQPLRGMGKDAEVLEERREEEQRREQQRQQEGYTKAPTGEGDEQLPAYEP